MCTYYTYTKIYIYIYIYICMCVCCNCHKPSLSCQVPANDIVERAVTSRRDGDYMCPTVQAISRASPNHEEDTVWKALSGSGLLVTIPCTHVDVGPGILRSHPCYKPQDLISSVATRGKLDMVFGTPVSTCTLPPTHVCLCCLSFVGYIATIPV